MKREKINFLQKKERENFHQKTVPHCSYSFMHNSLEGFFSFFGFYIVASIVAYVEKSINLLSLFSGNVGFSFFWCVYNVDNPNIISKTL